MTGQLLSRRPLLLLALIGALLVGGALPARADTTSTWDVAIQVAADGSFDVTETITQNFTSQRRGIFRYIPVTERIARDGLVTVPDGEVEDWFQRIRISDITVSSLSSGTPDATVIEQPGRHEAQGVLSLRIGEEDTFITGEHTYRISYHVEGAMQSLEDGTSLLLWDVVGEGWEQDINRADVRVDGPGIVQQKGSCVLGAVPGQRTNCDQVTQGSTFESSVTGLPAYTAMSVAVMFDSASVAPSAPILQRKFTLAGALFGDARAWPLAILTAALGFFGLGRLLYRSGRDRETRGDVTVDGRTDTGHLDDGASARTRALFTPRPVPIEFRPPEDLRPGQLGLIIDERVDPVDISATIVDMAVRGYLVIEELENKTLWWTRTDWTLRATDKDPTDLLKFEEFLYNGLFDARSEVDVSDLKGTFASQYSKAEAALYEDGRLRKWFAGRPDKVRAKWLAIGVASFAASFIGFGAAVYFSRVAIALVPVILVSMALLIAHRWMPRRTPKGSELLTRTLGFREFIETAETDRARFAEQEHLFIEYLPYAVVFGATEKWAQAFADLSILTVGTGLGSWYIWHAGSRGFNANAFSSGLSDFSASMGTAAVTAPPSSGGGFAGGGGFSGGGGFGGGGGGSW